MDEAIGGTRLPRTPPPKYDVITGFAADRVDGPMTLVNIDNGDAAGIRPRVGLDLCSASKDVAFCGARAYTPGHR